MAQGITYNVGAKYNPQGEKQAIKGLDKITGAAKKFNMAIGGFIIGKVFQGISKVVSGSTEEFRKNEKALANLNNSIRTSTKLTEGALDRLQDKMDAVSGGGLFGGDELNDATALAVQMGLTEEQINNVLEASTNLASSGVMPLETAVKNLSASYGGNLGQLQKLYPELKGLTKEQLEAGKAVDILKKKYDGFTESMATTFSGQDTRFKDAFGHLQESVGGILQGLKFGTQGALMEPLNNVAEWLETNKVKILKFFYNMPEVIKVIAKAGWEYVKRTFTGEGFKNMISYIGGSIAIMVKNIFPLALELLKSLALNIGDLANGTVGNLLRLFKDLLANIGNKAIEGLNSLVQKALSIKPVKWLYEHLSGNSADKYELIKFRFDNNNAKDNVKWDDVVDRMNGRAVNLINNYKESVKKSIKEQFENALEHSELYNDITVQALEDLQTAINKDLPDGLVKAMDAGGANEGSSDSTDISTGDSSSSTGITETTEEAVNSISKITDVLRIFGEVGEAVSLILEQNIIGLILNLIAKLVGALSEVSPAFDAFMNSISLLMKDVATIIAPIMEAIIMPFLNSLHSLGEIIGSVLAPALLLLQQIITPILNIVSQLIVFLAPFMKIIGTILSVIIQLNPVIKLFSMAMKLLADIFTFIYNYIFAPVMNFLLKIISTIGNFFIRMYNNVVGVLNSINIFGWHPFNISKAQEINYDELSLKKIEFEAYAEGDGHSSDYIDQSKGSGSMPAGSSGASASYTAVRDIIMNFEIGYVVGQDGMREFSLMIRDEIKEAEALGR